jgi:hypothetical protein
MSYSNGSMSSALDICLSKCVSVACMMCGLYMWTRAKNSCRFDSLLKLLQLTFKSMIYRVFLSQTQQWRSTYTEAR